MLQCTALTDIPELDAFVALLDMENGPDHPPDVLALYDHLLCELGEHDEYTEHAARLWPVELPDVRDLWMFWTGTGAHRVYRFDERPICQAVSRRLPVRHTRVCRLFAQHSATHSWDVTDPLGDLLTDIAREEVRRLYEEADDQDDTD
ncbi:hypothetical protein ACIODT_02275 [Streptomyces sp. NPDC088251]|uniref:hypothetical protein n=1 Tax=unclassified Streptomyces TaxID=2593676 RepID=UPI0037F6CF16